MILLVRWDVHDQRDTRTKRSIIYLSSPLLLDESTYSVRGFA
jgi:hypothetical protein